MPHCVIFLKDQKIHKVTGHNQISFDSIYIIQGPPRIISTALCNSGDTVIGSGFNNIQDNNPGILMTCRSLTSEMIGSQL
jgi:hypothetical protein